MGWISCALWEAPVPDTLETKPTMDPEGEVGVCSTTAPRAEIGRSTVTGPWMAGWLDLFNVELRLRLRLPKADLFVDALACLHCAYCDHSED